MRILLLTIVLAANSAFCDDFDTKIAPFRTFRDQNPTNLAAHERYQDAILDQGIEGHLRALGDEYAILAAQHPEDFHFTYLHARSLAGRNTPLAIRRMNQILSEHPDFSPAQQSLAKIAHPPQAPDPSPLVDEAEKLLAANGDPTHIIEMAQAGLRADEWRLQRIRPFDWYSEEFKRQAQRELRMKYWKVWAIEVRVHRKTGQRGKAADLLAEMERRAASGKETERAAVEPMLEELRIAGK